MGEPEEVVGFLVWHTIPPAELGERRLFVRLGVEQPEDRQRQQLGQRAPCRVAPTIRVRTLGG